MSGKSAVDAPYNFVPLSERVVDDWDEPAPNGVPCHDIPYSDGVCGEVTFEIVAESPLLVAGRDQDDKIKRFFRGPDGNPAVPGSATRGMIRNVVEIASFSRFKLVEDRRLGLRDLSGAVPEYTNKLVGKSNAGWLYLDESSCEWKIQPCEFARVDQGMVHEVAGYGDNLRTLLSRTPFPKTCVEAYGHFPEFDVERKVALRQTDRGWIVHPAHADGSKIVGGNLVFTGQPNEGKKKEFFFFDNSKELKPVSPVALAHFLAVHEEQEKASEAWKFWQQKLRDGTASRIPIFYITDNAGEIEAFGLAMMFKMAQKNSILDLLRRDLTEHLDEAGVRSPDLAERLFGRVSSQPEQSFKGRVQFGLADLVPGSSWREIEEIKTSDGTRRKLETVLGAPKPSWFAAYLEQGRLDASGKRLSGKNEKEIRGKYRTYMDDDAHLRGWKRYPVRPTSKILFPPPLPPSGISEDAKTKLSALLPREKGKLVTFRGILRFHNLRSYELGALLWAMTWGGDTGSRHRLGMGKPFGWGQVRMRCRDAKLRYNQPAESGQRPIYKGEAALQAALGTRKRFEEKMEAFVTGWSNSRQVQALRAMARVQSDPPHDLRYPKLDVDGDENEFTDLKKAGAVLPYWGIEPPETPDPQRGSNRGGAPGGSRSGHGGGRNPASRGSSAPASRRPATPLVFAAGTRVTDGEWEVTVIDDVPMGATEMTVRDENNDTEPVDVASYREIPK